MQTRDDGILDECEDLGVGADQRIGAVFVQIVILKLWRAVRVRAGV